MLDTFIMPPKDNRRYLQTSSDILQSIELLFLQIKIELGSTSLHTHYPAEYNLIIYVVFNQFEYKIKTKIIWINRSTKHEAIIIKPYTSILGLIYGHLPSLLHVF